MSDQQERLVKKMLSSEWNWRFGWGFVVGPAGTSGGDSNVLASEQWMTEGVWVIP
jgi:hypothetical protein